MRYNIFRSRGLGAVELEELLVQWALLLGEGFSLEKSLAWLRVHGRQDLVKKFCHRVMSGLENGMCFLDALKAAGGMADEWVFRIGREQSAAQRAKEMEMIVAELSLRQKWKGQLGAALIYPCCVLVLGLAVVLFALLYLVPQYEAVFQQMVSSGELPYITQVLVTAGELLRNHGFVYGAVFALLGAIGWWSWCNFPCLAHSCKSVAAVIPWIGSWYENQRTLLFCHELAVQLGSRVPLADTLQKMPLMHGDGEWKRLLDGLADEVFSGQTLASALEKRKLLKSDAVAIIAVGEASGRLPQTLEKARDAAIERQAALVRRFSALIEPAIIVFLALLIGMIALALFLPLVSLVEHMGHEW
jgi:type IV pilus assembly protein PilC